MKHLRWPDSLIVNEKNGVLFNLKKLSLELETLKLYGHENVEGALADDWVSGLRPPATGAGPQKAKDTKEDLDSIKSEVSSCNLCDLSKSRTNTVFGVGNDKARLMFIGEAPGADEDKQGEPFVGRAGKLLTKMIQSMGYQRGDVYIANILKCRPPGNRDPLPSEVDLCEQYLIRQIAAIGPKVICALGAVAARTLLKTKTPISKLRGEFHSYHGTDLLPTFHPAYLLRNPSIKKEAWLDLQMLMKRLDLLIPGKGS